MHVKRMAHQKSTDALGEPAADREPPGAPLSYHGHHGVFAARGDAVRRKERERVSQRGDEPLAALLGTHDYSCEYEVITEFSSELRFTCARSQTAAIALARGASSHAHV